MKVQDLFEDKDELAMATFTADVKEITKALKDAGVGIVRSYGKDGDKTIVVAKDDMGKANKVLKDINADGKFKLD